MMFSMDKHRIIAEIEKKRQKGQFLQFLTGDAISKGDNYFFDIYHGVNDLADTLKLYYFKQQCSFDYMIRISSDSKKISCYIQDIQDKKQLYGCNEEGMEVADFIKKVNEPQKKGLLANVKSQKPNNQKEAENSGDRNPQDVADAGRPDQIMEAITKRADKKFLVLIEGMEWVANLYGQEPDTTWIKLLQTPAWQKAKNLLTVVTVRDMGLLKEYGFVEEDTYVGMPSAEEIFISYWRYLMRNKKDDYSFSLVLLDDIAHSMSVGQKSLLQCMRVLRQVLTDNDKTLNKEDFAKCADLNIEETVKWDDVLLDADIKREIARAVDAFLNNQEGKEPRKGIILTGPPGTGKTWIAKALATEKHCNFMAPTLADLKGEYVGQSSAKIKRVFDEARANQPTIIFIDEADTVFPNRGGANQDSYGMDMVNEFLQQIDGAKTGKQQIFVIAATNRVEFIDPAIKSRLSSEAILIPLPSRDFRLKILEQKLHKYGFVSYKLAGQPYEDYVLDRTEGMSGRDIDNFAKKLREYCEGEHKQELTEDIFKEKLNDRETDSFEELRRGGVFSKVQTPEGLKQNLTEIIGYTKLIREIDIQAENIKSLSNKSERRRRRQYGIETSKGVLLYGPPGNGKTQLATTVAGKHGFYFFKVLSQDFASLGSEAQLKKIRKIFLEVEKFANLTTAPGVVLFFDEFDSLAGKDVLDPVVRGTLLDYLADENGLRSENSKVLLIAATNYFEKLDEAVKRTGRIDEHLFMDNPTKEEGIALLKHYLSDVQYDVDDFFGKAYEELTNVYRTNPNIILNKKIDYLQSRQILLHCGDSDIVKELKQGLEKVLELVRPSGSDLKNFANDLKAYAFRNNPPEEGKLFIKQEYLQAVLN